MEETKNIIEPINEIKIYRPKPKRLFPSRNSKKRSSQSSSSSSSSSEKSQIRCEMKEAKSKLTNFDNISIEEINRDFYFYGLNLEEEECQNELYNILNNSEKNFSESNFQNIPKIKRCKREINEEKLEFLKDSDVDDLFNELNNIYKNEFVNSIYNSWSTEKRNYAVRHNINFNHIDVIEKFFMKIKSQEQNEWIYDICILITFHQSLPNNEYRMNSPLLEEKYIKIFFDKRLAEMMRIIMIYDSASHSMFYGSYWPEQINKNMDEVMKLFV